jgi:hypothetical protein
MDEPIKKRVVRREPTRELPPLYPGTFENGGKPVVRNSRQAAILWVKAESDSRTSAVYN